jgi:predicted ArsR family transcriptional regulator
VLRYLPTNLSISEIASELYVSPNTVKTHIRHLYESSARTGARCRLCPHSRPARACWTALTRAWPTLACAEDGSEP